MPRGRRNRKIHHSRTQLDSGESKQQEGQRSHRQDQGQSTVKLGTHVVSERTQSEIRPINPRNQPPLARIAPSNYDRGSPRSLAVSKSQARPPCRSCTTTTERSRVLQRDIFSMLRTMTEDLKLRCLDGKNFDDLEGGRRSEHGSSVASEDEMDWQGHGTLEIRYELPWVKEEWAGKKRRIGRSESVDERDGVTNEAGTGTRMRTAIPDGGRSMWEGGCAALLTPPASPPWREDIACRDGFLTPFTCPP